jgi:hypothetical protein
MEEKKFYVLVGKISFIVKGMVKEIRIYHK